MAARTVSLESKRSRIGDEGTVLRSSNASKRPELRTTWQASLRTSDGLIDFGLWDGRSVGGGPRRSVEGALSVDGGAENFSAPRLE